MTPQARPSPADPSAPTAAQAPRPEATPGFAAPFQLDEGRHVAPGAVLGLQGAAEFDCHQLDRKSVV